MGAGRDSAAARPAFAAAVFPGYPCRDDPAAGDGGAGSRHAAGRLPLRPQAATKRNYERGADRRDDVLCSFGSFAAAAAWGDWPAGLV